MIDPIHIIDCVEQYFFLRKGALLSVRRFKTQADARAIAMYLIRQLTQLSYMEIADIFGRDHSTVIHNCKKIEKIPSYSTSRILVSATITLLDKLKAEESSNA